MRNIGYVVLSVFLRCLVWGFFRKSPHQLLAAVGTTFYFATFAKDNGGHDWFEFIFYLMTSHTLMTLVA